MCSMEVCEKGYIPSPDTVVWISVLDTVQYGIRRCYITDCCIDTVQIGRLLRNLDSWPMHCPIWMQIA